MKRVGVLAVQGAVSEHMDALRRADPTVDAVAVRTPKDLRPCSGLIMPGGESTTISRLLRSSGLQDEVLRRAKAGDLAVFGTCAGLILLCDQATTALEDKDVQLLGLLDATVDRNAFGRQRESFEAVVDIKGVGRIPTVYIRAPVVTEARKPTEVLARLPQGVVAVRKGRILGTAFHPELTGDTRMHKLFLSMCPTAPRRPRP